MILSSRDEALRLLRRNSSLARATAPQQGEIIEIVDPFVGRLEKRLKDKDMGIELTPVAKVRLSGNAKPRIPDALPLPG